MVERTTYSTDDIKGWLSTTGGPFEMRVAASLLAKGVRVEQGHYYTDPDDASKSREVDVIAYRGLAFETNARLDITAVIECKYAPTPWVTYRRSTMGQVRFLDRIASDYGTAWLKRVTGIAEITGQRLFRREDRPGYALGMSKPTKSGDVAPAADLAYKSMYGVTKASYALAAGFAAEGRIRNVSVIFPVIVIDGQLFDAILVGEELVVTEIQRAQVLWSYPASATGGVLIDVLTEQALDEFADDLVGAAEAAREHGLEAARHAVGDTDLTS